MSYGKEKYQRRVEYLKRLGELMEEFNAEFAINTEFQSEGSFTTEIEVYVDGCSILCGDQRGGLTASGIERMLNCASESLAEAEAYS